MDLNSQVENLDEELKLLKNEIKQVLLEIQEHVLNAQNPFSGNLVFNTPGEFSPGPQIPQVVVHTEAPSPDPTPPPSEQPAGEAGPAPDNTATGPDTEEGDQGRSDPAPQPGPAAQGTTTSTGRTTRETGAGRTAREAAAKAQARQDTIDLITIAGMAQWTDRVMKKLGRENTEALLNVSEQTGRIPPDLKKALLALIPLFEPDGEGFTVSAKDVVVLLAQLDGLMGTGSPAEVRLLPFLLQDSPEVFPLIQP